MLNPSFPVTTQNSKIGLSQKGGVYFLCDRTRKQKSPTNIQPQTLCFTRAAKLARHTVKQKSINMKVITSYDGL